MKVIRFALTGVSPLLQNPMTESTLDELQTGNRKPIQKDRTRADVAKEKVIVNDKGEIGIPSNYLFAALKAAGRKVKSSVNSKSNISTAKGSTLPSFLTFRERFFPFTHIENNGEFGWLKTYDQPGYPDGVTEVPWVPDRRRGVMHNAGKDTAVAIIRPMFMDPWTVEGTFELDEDECNFETAKKLFKIAASQIGVGDFRPACGGEFGRSSVTAFEEIADESEPVQVEAVAGTGKSRGSKAKAKAAGEK